MKKLVTLLFLGITLSLGVFARPALAGTGVFVNGRSLSVSQLIAVSRALDYVPAPGYYWYDPRSGNYGRVGGSGGGPPGVSASGFAGAPSRD